MKADHLKADQDLKFQQSQNKTTQISQQEKEDQKLDAMVTSLIYMDTIEANINTVFKHAQDKNLFDYRFQNNYIPQPGDIHFINMAMTCMIEVLKRRYGKRAMQALDLAKIKYNMLLKK